MDLDRFPRVRLAHLPTPIEPMARLSAHLGGPTLYVKRDDCTGLALGGNKTRKLEFLMAQAVGAGADTVVTMGGAQSNHARQTAAAAAQLGLSCVLILRQNVQPGDPSFLASGNILLDHLTGAEVHIVAVGEAQDDARARIMADLAAAGRNSFFIPIGGATALGDLGYAAAAAEIVDQCYDAGLSLDRIVHATGSGGTQAGLLAGLHALGAPIPVLGVCVSLDRSEQEAVVWSLTEETADLIGGSARPARGDVVADANHYGGVYGVVQDATLEAVRLVARLEGLILDPIYTGVAMAGLIDGIGKGTYSPRETILFIHTGGTPGLFGYVDRITSGVACHGQ